jgi:hypothetical protein
MAAPFWNAASMDTRVTSDFKLVCKSNADAVTQASGKVSDIFMKNKALALV